jgi:flagellar protein FliO/FliZ
MTQSIPPSQWFSLVASFVAVLALLAGTLYLLRRFANGGPSRASDRRIQAVETYSLGARQRLLLVRVDDKEMLLGVSQQQTTVLGSWPASDARRPERGRAQSMQEQLGLRAR